MSGKDQKTHTGGPPEKESGSKRFQARGHASGEELGILGLSDIKLLRLGWPSAVFEEWKSSFVMIMTAMYGPIARSLAPGSTQYYRPKLTPYQEFMDKRLAELRGTTQSTSSASAAAPARRGLRTNSTDATAGVDDDEDELTSYIKDNYKDLLKENTRAIAAMEQQREKMFSTIWMRMSKESQERVKMSTRSAALIARDDPLQLWLAIQETHSMYVSGNTVYDANLAWTSWYNMRQGPSQGLPQYKEAFDAAFEEIVSRVAVDRHPTDAERAIQFITSLDPTRFAELQMTYRNKLQTYPTTLSQAYKVAAEWVILPRGTLQNSGNRSSHSAFHIQAAASAYLVSNKEEKEKSKKKDQKSNKKSSKAPATKKDSDTDKPAKGDKADKSNTNTCFACKKDGHYARECPLFKKFLQSIGTNQRSYATIGDEGNEPESDDADDIAESFAREFGQKHVSFVITDCVSTVDPPIDSDLEVLGPKPQPAHGAAGGGEWRGERGEDMVMTTASPKPDMSSTVLLDNQATRGVFGNNKLLTSIKETAKVITFSGVGGTRKTNLIGYFDPLDIWVSYIPDLGFNVLSFSQVEQKHNISYHPREAFVVETSGGNYRFGREPSGLWSCDFSDTETRYVVTVQTVKDNEKRFSRREVEAAKAARDLSKRLGYPAKADLQRMLTQGVLHNTPVTARDVERAYDIYGPEVAAQKGKTRLGKPTVIPTVPLPKYVYTELMMAIDIMSVEAEKFLLSVTLPLGLLMVAPIPDKTVDTIRLALNSPLREYKAREFIVHTILCDNEGAFTALKGELQEAGIKLETASANKHVPVIEVRIKLVKERCRAVLNTLPYLLPRSKLKHLVNYAVSRINLVPTSTLRRDGVSPRESFMGRRADVKVDARIAFGTYVQVHTFAEPINSMAPRTEAAIALEPTGNANGSVLFWTPRSNKIVTRSEWPGGEMPMPEDLTRHINRLDVSEGHISRNVKFRIGNHEVVDIPVPTEPADVRAPLRRVLDGSNTRDTDGVSVGNVLPPRDTPRDTSQEGETVTTPDSPIDGVVQPLPPSEPPPSEHVLHISMKESIKRYGNAALSAIEGEVDQMVKQGVFEPVKRGSLNKTEWKKVIRSHLFLTAKYDADGTFQKLKARLVAGGNTQDRTVYDSVASPTACLTAVLTVATMAARERRKIMVVDITGAYLNASMGDETVYVRLDAHVSSRLGNLDPKFKGCTAEDGSMVVKLKKALYGCIQSAKLWFETLTNALRNEYGMEANPYEACVLNKVTQKGKLTVVIYVDDLFIAGTSDDAVADITTFLEDKFKTITKKQGTELSYLGMVFAFNGSSVTVSMPKYVNDILTANSVDGSVATPATNGLYD
eukprot:gene15176-16944_t